jgi:4-hydroxy-3-polyprenylbenzoate decarboxylase
LEGYVPPFERRTEGPFGDHLGHYSHSAPHPVFHVSQVHRRRAAIYPATVVGKPPQEDKYLGNAVQEMLLPLLKVMRPELADLWAYQEAGFHNLAAVSVRQRYAKEGIKTALGLMGQGQMSLTKCVVLVDPGVNARNFAEVLDALRANFDPAEDFVLIPGTSQDTLDFTSFKMNLGSKMILDATGGKKNPPPREPFPARLVGPGNVPFPCRSLRDSLLVVQVPSGSPLSGRETVEWLVREGQASRFKLIAAVSPDVPLDDDELLLWGLFTRFDCARDVVPAGSALKSVWPTFTGPLGIDATRKPGYPEPLAMDPGVVQRVNARWGDYGL